jgi:hypothetical protein
MAFASQSEPRILRFGATGLNARLILIKAITLILTAS